MSLPSLGSNTITPRLLEAELAPGGHRRAAARSARRQPRLGVGQGPVQDPVPAVADGDRVSRDHAGRLGRRELVAVHLDNRDLHDLERDGDHDDRRVRVVAGQAHGRLVGAARHVGRVEGDADLLRLARGQRARRRLHARPLRQRAALALLTDRPLHRRATRVGDGDGLDLLLVHAERRGSAVGSTTISASALTSTTGKCTSATSAPPACTASVVSAMSPNRWSPPISELTSAVTVMTCVAPGATVNAAGSTVTPTPSGASTTAVYAEVVSAMLVTSRVNVQTSRQFWSTNAGRLRVRGSPPVSGSAARKSSVDSSMISPTRPAASRSRRPEPTSNGSEGVWPSSLSIASSSAVDASAERISAGDQSGCRAFSSAPAPAPCGEAIEVPCMNS